MALDKFFCKTADVNVNDKQVEFHSEKEANEYCRENGIDPHNVILIGDKYIVKTKDSNFRTTMDEAINEGKDKEWIRSVKGDNAVVAKVYDPIMCMMVDKPDKAQDAMNKAIETADAEGEKWITMRGSHVKIDGEGNAIAGNAKVKNIINNGKSGPSKENSGSAREKLSSMSRSDLNHFAEMYGDYDDAESFRKEDIIEDMIEEHGEEKVGKMLNTFNEMFSKGKEKKKENPVAVKKKNESTNSNASAREKLSGMSRSDLEHFAEMYGGYEDARGIRKDDIIDDMIDDYGEEKVNKMLETYNGIFKKKGNDSASALDEAIRTTDRMFNADQFADYLWRFADGREIASMLLNEGLDKYSGPHDKEHKEEAYAFAKQYAMKELENFTKQVRSAVEKRLKDGYSNAKNSIISAK